jgi:hypothetical protein
MGTKIFDLVTLTLLLDLLIENFNLGYIFWLVGIRALTFQMSVPCDKTYPWVWKVDLLTFVLVFDLLIKNFNLGYNFCMASTRGFDISHEYSLW